MRRSRIVLAALAAAALALATPRAGAQPAPAAPGTEPPLNITADNVSGSHDEGGDVVLLNGHLRVTRGRSVLTADRGRYFRQEGRLEVEGHVNLVDSTTTVTCDRATYSETADVLDLDGNVVVKDRDATLRAPRGRYDRKRAEAQLEGGVEGREKKQRLLADRAVYVRDSSIVRARGNCRGIDDENKLELQGPSIDFDRQSHVAVATGEPVLKSTDDDGKITLIRAKRLTLDTESRVAEALDSVTVERDTLRGRADRALFDDRAQRGWLFGSPRVWDDQTTVSGDTLEMVSEGRRPRRVVVSGHAAIDYRGNRPNSLGESSRLTGQRADIWFTKDAIDSLVAIGDARNSYSAPPKAGKTAESNEAFGDTITVFFKDRKVDRAQVEGGAHGEYRLAVAEGDTSAAKNEIVTYEGTRITFVVPKNRIVLDRSAKLAYGDLQLQSRRVEYDVDAQTLVAEGSPQLIEKGDKVTGHLMTYDMTSRVGTIYQAETEYEKGLYHGERIRRVAENELDVLHGAYSTCDLPEPHYHFAAKYMKIYLKDKLVAKPVVFYVRNVPLLALPFWIFPIKPGRHSGFLFPQFEFGFSTTAGQFIRNAGYYWAPNDYMDLTLSGDYYQAEPSWVLRAEGLYKLLYVLDGDFRGTFARNERLSTDDWDFYANHHQEVTPRTNLSARGQFVSSRSYNASNLYGRPLSQRLNRFLSSSLALTHNADWASLTMALDRQQDLDADDAILDPDGAGPLQGPPPGTNASLANLTENTPNLSLSFPTRTLGSLPFLRGTSLEKPLASAYFSFSSHFQSTFERRAYVAGYSYFTNSLGQPDSTTFLDQRVTTRRGFATNASLSDARRLFGFLNVSPQVNGDLVVFDFDEQGNRVVPATTWSAGAQSSASLYGTFRTHLGPIVGLRHILTPSVSYAYAPGFANLVYKDSTGQTRPRFNSFGSIGISGVEQSFLTYGLDQRLQFKLQSGDRIRRLDNLLSLTTRGTYNFLWRESGQAHPFSPLTWGMFVQPPSILSASAGWTTDFYQPRPLRNLNYNVGLNLTNNNLVRPSSTPDLPLGETRTEVGSRSFAQEWSLGIAYSYAGGYATPTLWQKSQTANAVFRTQFSRNWEFEYSTSADVTNRRLSTQRFGLSRTLHCWIATFSRVFVQGGEAEYYFRIGVKDQRELYYERGTRSGSIGGIQ